MGEKEEAPKVVAPAVGHLLSALEAPEVINRTNYQNGNKGNKDAEKENANIT